MAVAALLRAFVGMDPAPGVTSSRSPFTDESWNLFNARNLVLLGRWSTDQCNLHLLTVPYSLVEAAAFSVLGVGVVQGRIVPIVAVGATVLLLGVGLRRSFGAAPALLAALAYGTSLLMLFYGRMACPEVILAVALSAGAMLSAQADGPRSTRWGILAGLLFGVGIATKANALFPTVGFLGAILLVQRSQQPVRRWLAGAIAGVALVGASLAVVVFVPNQDAVMTSLPHWVDAHPLAWASRVERYCLEWPPGSTVCLYELP